MLALPPAQATPSVKLQPDFALRLRGESREQNVTFNDALASPTDGSWLLLRIRVGLKAEWEAPGASFYAQLQDARELGSDRPSIPFVLGSEGDDPLDFRQAYFEQRASDYTLRLGRQLLALGDERLVGTSDWSNVGRSFDAARLTLPRVGAGLDLFAASVVQVQPGAAQGWQTNHSSSSDVFAGGYSRFALRPTLQVEPYVLWRHKKADTLYTVPGVGSARPYDIPQRIAMLGVRWSGGPPAKLGGFDYDGEFAWQTGQVRGRQRVDAMFAFPGPGWLVHHAWAAHFGVGFTTATMGFPVRFYVEHNRATGDRNPADQRDESFLNLFPTNHKFYGALDALAWKNMSEMAFTALATFNPGAKLRLEFHDFNLVTTEDAWFRSNGVSTVRALTPAARAASRAAGQELDLVFSRTVNPHVSVDAG
ncbi:MAG: hypothetical protein RIQ93_3173, partial [Verrucomicrobiota bacterium]